MEETKPGFLEGNQLSDAIRSILREPGAKAAVAFWGRDSDNWVTAPDARIVCNLATGSSNPAAIKALGARARQLDTLHAKVYVGAQNCIVASANASANGLGLEGEEQAYWVEAGHLSSEAEAVGAWFERLWRSARPITEGDLHAAEELWRRRRTTKPRLSSFAVFDPEAEDMPLVAWQHPLAKWELVDEAFTDLEPEAVADLRRRAEGGLEVSHPDDLGALRNRWVLFFRRSASGRPDRRAAPWFERAGDHLMHQAFKYAGDERARDILLMPENTPAVPFDAGEPKFVKAFRAAIADPLVSELLDDDDEQRAWYEPRLSNMRGFWRIAKRHYNAAEG